MVKPGSRFSLRRTFNAVRNGFNAGRVVKRAYRGYKALTRTSTRSRRGREVAPLTSQHDFRVTYSKKRMPKRKKRAYVKSVKRFRAMNMKQEPARIHQLVNVQEYTSGINTSRYFGCFMNLLGNNVYDTALTNVADSISGGTSANEKMRAGGFRLDHSSLRCVIRNLSNAGETVDLDVYKVICIRDIPIGLWANGTRIESMHATLKATMRQHQGMDIEVGNAGAGIPTLQENAGTSSTNQVVGDLLWNAPPFLRYWKIVKQFKIQLPVGNTTEFSLRNTSNKYIPYNNLFDSDKGQLAAKAYVTQGYIFNINGRADIIDTVPSFDDVRVVVEQYVRYNVKAVPGTSPTLVYDSAQV